MHFYIYIFLYIIYIIYLNIYMNFKAINALDRKMVLKTHLLLINILLSLEKLRQYKCQ